MNIVRIHFEVWGLVQGVYFRNHIVEKANSLSIVGWCRNTSNGSVEIEAEGKECDLEVFKKWLQYEGSPLSRVDNIVAKEISVKNNEKCMKWLQYEGSPLSRVDNIVAKEISVKNNEKCMVRYLNPQWGTTIFHDDE
ncbi:hypothetical protein PORY_002345 [Pneumocystis oryctolagi]|uniref:Uncharacterized protein n=1 Tax=Pneumocystis oryctolagi TaxID=42067 RepID=A0ACB7C8Z2_9ASCO|nr:hypothetical protein PORY_002345 [Pneumocystis oryctolagi]